MASKRRILPERNFGQKGALSRWKRAVICLLANTIPPREYIEDQEECVWAFFGPPKIQEGSTVWEIECPQKLIWHELVQRFGLIQLRTFQVKEGL